MNNALQTLSRERLEAHAMQHFRNDVLDTILYNAPIDLADEAVEQVENTVLAQARELVSRLNDDYLRDQHYMDIMVSDAMSETRDLLRKAAARQAWINQQRTRTWTTMREVVEAGYIEANDR
ncbi:MAG: hypothetical protein LC114_05900 [Bryobacterales bacterium]|nr:hypothetical protein [Bryobacterales bacterium]